MNELIEYIKVKRLHPDAVLPIRGSEGAAGYDLTAVTLEKRGDLYIYGTGLAFEIPPGYYGALCARSSIAFQPLHKCGGVTIIDSDYRGEVFVMFRNIPRAPLWNLSIEGFLLDQGKSKSLLNAYKVGDRVAQLIIQKYTPAAFKLVDELSETTRGPGGYGSTGR